MKKLIITLLILACAGAAHAQEKVIPDLKFPITASAISDKMEFCYIAQEKLRLQHNAKGKDYTEGKITKEQWEAYKKDEFDVKQEVIIKALLEQKEAMKKSTKYEVDLNDLATTAINP